MKRELERALARGDNKGAQRIVDEIDGFRWRVLAKHDWFWRDVFESQCHPGFQRSFVDPVEAARLIANGKVAVTRQAAMANNFAWSCVLCGIYSQNLAWKPSRRRWPSRPGLQGVTRMFTKRPSLSAGQAVAGLPMVIRALHADDRCELYALDGMEQRVLIVLPDSHVGEAARLCSLASCSGSRHYNGGPGADRNGRPGRYGWGGSDSIWPSTCWRQPNRGARGAAARAVWRTLEQCPSHATHGNVPRLRPRFCLAGARRKAPSRRSCHWSMMRLLNRTRRGTSRVHFTALRVASIWFRRRIAPHL